MAKKPGDDKITDLETFLEKLEEKYPELTWNEAPGAHMMVDPDYEGPIGTEPPATFEQKFSNINLTKWTDLAKCLNVLNGTDKAAKSILEQSTQKPNPFARGALKAKMPVDEYVQAQIDELYARNICMAAMISSLAQMYVEYHDNKYFNVGSAVAEGEGDIGSGAGVHENMRTSMQAILDADD
tara:strand:- start:1801 stop:2349 length:549 start_codon:yes stop_codon:yes gene_type:complete